MNKELEYRGYKFNIKVELNTKVEKRFNGDRWHKIITNCMDYDNYYDLKEVQDKDLEFEINAAQGRAKDYIDSKLSKQSYPYKKRLEVLGFKQSKLFRK